MILDATFIAQELRARAEATARDLGVAFEGVWLEAPADCLRTPIERRAGDASDATVATLESQLARDLGPLSWTVLDASAHAEALALGWRPVA